jgi:hypothetical protein
MKKTFSAIFAILAIAVMFTVTSCNPAPSYVDIAKGVNQQTDPTDLKFIVKLQGPFLDRLMVPAVSEVFKDTIWIYFPDKLYKQAVFANQSLIAGDTVIATVKMTKRTLGDHKFMVLDVETIKKKPVVVIDTTSKIIGEVEEIQPPVKKKKVSGSGKNDSMPVIMPVTPVQKEQECCCSVTIVNNGSVNAPINVTVGTEQRPCFTNQDPIIIPYEGIDRLDFEKQNMPTINF